MACGVVYMFGARPGVSSKPGRFAPADFGAVARAHPDVSFLVYDAGYETGNPEAPYKKGNRGIDAS